jgi:hypothetical protein
MKHHDRIFELFPDIRYVAIYRGGRLDRVEREGISDASSSESDRYEELLVNRHFSPSRCNEAT